MNGTILVVGGAGFIGSHVNKLLHSEGYKTVVLDNLCRGSRESVVAGDFVEADFGDRVALSEIFKNYTIDAVMHFAAFTDVGESMTNPLLYTRNNLVNTIILLNTMIEHDVKKIVFSSSAAVYGVPDKDKVTESDPKLPINYYGMTKLEVEEILKKYGEEYGLESCSLRYFNAAGGDPDGEIKNTKEKENNIIPIVLRSLITGSQITIFGTDYPTSDGTCIRDYIHVMDLAKAHILAMENLHGVTCYNLGNGTGYSVHEVIAMAEKVAGKKVNICEGDRREGDPVTLMADATKAEKELGWKPQHKDLESMVRDAWTSYDKLRLD